MHRRNIIVVGASAGGREALIELCQTLPSDLPAALFIVWHMPPTGVGVLPRMLGKASRLPVQAAADNELIRMGHIYVAPLDHHLLLEHDRTRVTKGPRENRFRPAVDPLFRSGAYEYGPRVIGVILSGALNDGTAGLWAIKDRGGLAVVQDPEDAIVSGMPLSALENVEVDYRVPISDMAALLSDLARETVTDAAPSSGFDTLGLEVAIAKDDPVKQDAVRELGLVSEYTCPECHGTLWQMFDGKILRFRCRTGHAYTAETLLEDMGQSVEAMQWATVRGMEESVALLHHMSGHLREQGLHAVADRYLDLAHRVRKNSKLVRDALARDDQPVPQESRGTVPV